MGCTSSTPNVAASHANNTEKNLPHLGDSSEQALKEIEKVTCSDKGNETNEINVLPTCDTLGDRIQLVRNKSLIDATSKEHKQDDHVNAVEAKSDNIIDEIETLQTEEKLSKLEEVVEKVVELYGSENVLENTRNVPDNDKENECNIDNEVDEIEVKLKLTKNDEFQNETENEIKDQNDENFEESLSPSQSVSSRVTRWEALADIAAELPPSLAVDPVTGQIYTLSK